MYHYKEMYTPTVKQIIEELSKHNPEDKVWFDVSDQRHNVQRTPISHIDGGSYKLTIANSQYQNTIYFKVE